MIFKASWLLSGASISRAALLQMAEIKTYTRSGHTIVALQMFQEKVPHGKVTLKQGSRILVPTFCRSQIAAALGKPSSWRCQLTDLGYSYISITNMNLLHRKQQPYQRTKQHDQSLGEPMSQSKVRLELAAEAKPAGGAGGLFFGVAGCYPKQVWRLLAEFLFQ